MREALWRAFAAEADGAVLRTLAHAVAKASEGWADLLPGLVQMLGATNDAGRQAAVFFLLEQMAEFSPELKQGAGGVAGVLGAALDPGMPPLVKIAAVKAWLALLTNLQTDHLLTHATKAGAGAASVQLSAGAEALKPLAPLALQAVAALLAQEGEVGYVCGVCGVVACGGWGGVGGLGRPSNLITSLHPPPHMSVRLGAGGGAGGGADGAGGGRGGGPQGLPAPFGGAAPAHDAGPWGVVVLVGVCWRVGGKRGCVLTPLCVLTPVC